MPQPTLLYVDEDVALSRFVAAALSRSGYSVHVAEHAWEALRILGRERTDVLITELALRGVDGRRLALRAWALDPELPIVFVAGEHTRAHCLPARDHRRTRCLAKPFFIGELTVAIAQLTHAVAGRTGHS